jgi:hypothetical protein
MLLKINGCLDQYSDTRMVLNHGVALKGPVMVAENVQLNISGLGAGALIQLLVASTHTDACEELANKVCVVGLSD